LNRLLYCLLLITFFYITATSSFCAPVLQISEWTYEEVIIDIDESINTAEYKILDLFRVYEHKITREDGEIQYRGYVDTLYIIEIHEDMIIFNYVWQGEWRNIKTGYYVVPAGMKYQGKSEEIIGILTAQKKEQKKEQKTESGKEEITTESNIKRNTISTMASTRATTLIGLGALGATVPTSAGIIPGPYFSMELLLIIAGKFGTRLFVSTDFYRFFNPGVSIEYALCLKHTRFIFYLGGINNGTSSGGIIGGMALGVFLPKLSPKGDRKIYFEFDIQGSSNIFGNGYNESGAFVISLKIGYRLI
jgi:hypothetical protein